jgi:hypothetical protein
LIEEFAKAGTSVVFVRGPRGDSPGDALLVQFQGMIAEYERAQILERTRRGKTHRAKAGTINVRATELARLGVALATHSAIWNWSRSGLPRSWATPTNGRAARAVPVLTKCLTIRRCCVSSELAGYGSGSARPGKGCISSVGTHRRSGWPA